MAGIEKVCEFSGDYPGCDMYGYKRNSIQVCPEYRKEFIGKEHTLYIWVDAYHGRVKRRNVYKWNHQPRMTVANYGYVLYVPSLPGEVKGQYWNWAYDLRPVKHNLRKILGLRSAAQLNIVRLPNQEAFDRLMKNQD